MVELREDRGDATPIPIELRGEATSRLTALDQDALLDADEPEDYVVEVVEAGKSVGEDR
jgi:hypothetical protein